MSDHVDINKLPFADYAKANGRKRRKNVREC